MRRTTGQRSRLAASIVSTLLATSLAACGSDLKPGREHETKVGRAAAALTVSNDVQHDISPPLSSISVAQPPRTHRQHHQPLDVPLIQSSAPDPVIQSRPVSFAIPTTNNSFAGVGNGFSGPQGTFTVNSAPPDTNGDVGPNHYVQIVNTDFAVFNKTGTVLYGPVPINALWSGFGGLCQTDNDGDPVVKYDRMADRWIISQFAVTGGPPYLQCVAVSTSGDPTGTYARYAFQYSNFPDYPKIGVWPDAYYITMNQFSGGTTFVGALVCAYERAKMLSGAGATQVCFSTSASFGGLLPSDLDGPTLPPAGSPNYLLNLDTNSLDLWKFHVDFTTPSNSTFTGPTNFAVAGFSTACGGVSCIPQSGTRQLLDGLDDRLMYRNAYRNFGDHEALVTNHSVDGGGHAGVRWYELRNPGGSITVFQQGTYAPDTSYRWMGSIAMDHSGDMAVGFSISSSSRFPGIHYAGRLASDALGVMGQGEATITEGSGSQTRTLNRWGDYSSMAIDPSDDCTFWYTNEYLPSSGTFNWSTLIASFKFPGCSTTPSDFSISISPASQTLFTGGSTSYTVTTAVTSGSAQTVNLSVSGLPAGVSGTFSPASVTAGGSSTLTLVAAANAASTAQTSFTVTGVEGSTSHSTMASVAVSASDFSISISPTSQSSPQGSTASYTVTTAIATGAAQSVSLAVSGLPSGVTGAFNPTSITGNGSSTLTLTISSAAAVGGPTTFTVTGTGPSATHPTSASITVTAPPPSDFSIAASPTSLSVAQGGSGNTTISAQVTSGTAQSVTLSASGQPAGVTTAFGTNPISSANGSSTLTVSVSGSAAPGTYTLTVTGAGTTTHSISVTLTVSASDFSLSANPSGVSVAQGGSGSSTINSAVTAGSPQTVALSVSGQPAGVTASLSPTSISSANGSSTLAIAVGSSVATGTYSLTVTGAGGSATHSTVVMLTVTQPGVVNGGFESGNFSGWTTAGSTAIVTSPVHSGSFAARVGSTSPSTDSSIAQTFTVPASGGSLSFWYQVHCPDTVTYDWATATLRDNVANTTSAILSNTCTNNSTWVQVVADLTANAGHSVTLTLANHDDNYPSDPTYTLYDDIALLPPVVNPIANPGFETGTFSGWTTSGATAIVTSPVHSGTRAAQVGSTSPSADSSIAQTFTVPSTAAGTLTFWYQVHCPDTVTYDWATATVHDNTANTTVTALGRTCTNNGTWVQASASVSPGHSVTLTFTNHDDGYPTDPTYTIVDDFRVQ